MTERRFSLVDGFGSVLVFAGMIALWWCASHMAWINPIFLPTPEAMFNSLSNGMRAGELRSFTYSTVVRMLEGWFLASLLGIVFGVLIGMSAMIRAYLQPTLDFIRPLPASALLPLAIAIFGLGPNMVLSVVAFGAMWPVLLATVHGLGAVDPRLIEMARCLQLGRGATILKIGLPNAMPDILAGMRLSLTVSLIVTVVGEMITSQSGLGYAILLAARSFRASELFAGIVVLGVIGLVSNALLSLAEHRLLAWQR
jgi:sulfonate transport system permease protein